MRSNSPLCERHVKSAVTEHLVPDRINDYKLFLHYSADLSVCLDHSVITILQFLAYFHSVGENLGIWDHHFVCVFYFCHEIWCEYYALRSHMWGTFHNIHHFIWTHYFIQGSDTMYGKIFMKNNLSVHTCVALWPLLSPGLPQSCLHSLSPACLLHPQIHGICNASLWTVSSYIVLGFPTGIVLWNFPLRIFWGDPVTMNFAVPSRVPVPCVLYWAIYS